MTSRRNKVHPQLKFSFWKKDGELYYANTTDLEAAIKASGNTEAIIMRRMGHSFFQLEEVMRGNRIDEWSAAHIEWGLTPDNGEFRHSPSTSFLS